MIKTLLLTTHDFNQYKRLKNLLDNQGIEYKVIVISEESSKMLKVLYRKYKMYSIFVAKKDLEVGRLLLNQIR